MNARAEIYSNHIQRQMVYEFASSYGFTIIREIAEWQGVSHFPQVKSTLSEHPGVPVIISTKSCIDVNDSDHLEFLNYLQSINRPVYFALGNLFD